MRAIGRSAEHVVGDAIEGGCARRLLVIAWATSFDGEFGEAVHQRLPGTVRRIEMVTRGSAVKSDVRTGIDQTTSE